MITITRVQNGWILCLDGDYTAHGPEYVYNKAEDMLKDLAVALVQPRVVDQVPPVTMEKAMQEMLSKPPWEIKP